MKIPFSNKLYRFFRGFFNFGLFNGFKYGVALFAGKTVRMKIKGYMHRIWVRGKDSDVVVVHDVLVRNEYASPALDEIDLILDLGANVGYSAIYFANRYPRAKVVAIEPWAENYEYLVRNVAPYENISTENVGVWWRDAKVLPVNAQADSWAFRFEEAVSGDGVQCTTVGQLIEKYGPGKSVMVKMDIEGAERDIFEKNAAWLDSIRFLQVEIHDCWKSIFDTLSRCNYRASIRGENVVVECNLANNRSTGQS